MSTPFNGAFSGGRNEYDAALDAATADASSSSSTTSTPSSQPSGTVKLDAASRSQTPPTNIGVNNSDDNQPGGKPPEGTESTPTSQQTPATPVDQLAATLENLATSRNYEGLDPEDVEVFKSMSNSAYAKLRPMFDAIKKAGLKLEDFPKISEELNQHRNFRFAEHPRAFELSEEYESGRTLVNNISTVNGYWKQQLAELRANKPVSLLTRDANGNLIPGPPQPATPAIEAQIIQELSQTSADLIQAKNELNNLASTFKNNHKQYSDTLGKVHTDLFGKIETVLKPKAEEYLQRFPSFARNKPEVRLAAYALAALVSGSAQKQAAATQAAAKTAAAAAASAGGPTTSQVTAGATREIGQATDAEYKDFKARYGIN